MPLSVKINVALREQNCQKIGSERVKGALQSRMCLVCFQTVLDTLCCILTYIGEILGALKFSSEK